MTNSIIPHNNKLAAAIRCLSSSIIQGLADKEKNSRPMGYTYVSEMPVEIMATYEGYLLYDVENELFAGYDGSWQERSRYILIEGHHIEIPVGIGIGIGIMEQKIMGIFKTGEEVLLVPCKSHESIIGDDLFVYQEFDWQWAFSVKSRSGKLSII